MSNQPSEPAIMSGKTSPAYVVYMQLGVGDVHHCMNIAPPEYAYYAIQKIIVNIVNNKQTHQEGNWNLTPCTKWDCSQKPCRCKLTWNLKDIRRGWIGHSNITHFTLSVGRYEWMRPKEYGKKLFVRNFFWHPQDFILWFEKGLRRWFSTWLVFLHSAVDSSPLLW